MNDMHTDHIVPVIEAPETLAEAVAADGFDAHRRAVTELVDDARRVGICELLAAVSLDHEQPLVVRQRAFGRLVVAYVSVLEHRSSPIRTPIDERFTVAA